MEFPKSSKFHSCLIFLCASLLAQGQAFTTLTTFTGANGDGPAAALIQAPDGNFYGATTNGGGHGAGEVFKITPQGALIVVYSFAFNSGSPHGKLVRTTDGTLYGTTSSGGETNEGAVYKIAPDGTFTILHSFSNDVDGAGPVAGLTQAADGSFYGTTSHGGAKKYGTAFHMTPDGTLTTIYNFTGTTDGSFPYSALVVGPDGNLYGRTQGGINGGGTVFQLTPAGVLTNISNFPANASSGDGGTEPALLLGADGNLYGTTFASGTVNGGTFFKMTLSGNTTILYHFGTNATDGTGPKGDLVQGPDGTFYGTTTAGGAGGWGTIFQVTPAGVLTTLYSFQNKTDGQYPSGGLVQGSDGNLYGTTQTGGNDGSGLGTIFRLAIPSAPSGPIVTAVVNAFSNSPAIAPNTWVAIKGTNLAPAGDSRIWQSSDFVSNQMPTALDGVSVTINGEPAYVYFISAAQLNILTPPDLAPGPVQVLVTVGTTKSPAFTVQALAMSIAFFVFNGGPYVIGTHVSGSDIGTTTLFPGLTTPAQPGEVVVLYGNGFGAPTTAIVKGSATQSGTLLPVPVIQIGGVKATVQFAGLVSPGLYQFNVVVPATAANGDNSVIAQYGGQSTQSGVLIAVQGNNPPQVQSLTLSTNSLTTGGTAQGTVTLSTPALSGGSVVTLTSNGVGAQFPASVTVAAGATSATFTITALNVSTTQQVTITASYQGSSAQASLTIAPAQ